MSGSRGFTDESPNGPPSARETDRPRDAAERDVGQAVDYYTDEAGEDIAHGFFEAVREAYRAISARPGIGSPRYADLLGVAGLRNRKLARFPYLVFYVEREDHIDVWRVLHAQRDIPATLGET
jgi:toxin ParE1/3/4